LAGRAAAALAAGHTAGARGHGDVQRLPPGRDLGVGLRQHRGTWAGLQRGDLLRYPLPGPGRDRPLLVAAVGGTAVRAVRLVQGSLWRVLAGRAGRDGPDAAQRGARTRGPAHRGLPEDEEVRPGGPAAGLRWGGLNCVPSCW